MSWMTGMRLAGRYVLINRVGAGGMSEVWQATDEVLGRTVAVKALAASLAADAALRATTRQEARAAAGLAHPHVTQVYDYGEAESTDGPSVPYLVMELLHGQTLDARLQTGPLPWEQAVQLNAEVADALSAAHRLGIVHRDIKPGNVMLSPRGAKVLDFGIAALTGGRADTDGGWLVGTPTYAAPERARSGPADPSADVYSLGALLYECLTGHPPHHIDRWAEAAAAHATPVEPLRVPGLPADVAALADRCLHPDPAQRPTAAQVARILGAAVGRPTHDDTPTAREPAYKGAMVVRPTMVEPLPAGTPTPPTPRGWNRAALLTTVGVVAAAVLIALLVAAWPADRHPAPAAVAAPTGAPASPATVPSDPLSDPPPTDAAGALAALRAGIDAGVAAGDIDDAAAQRLRKALQDLGRRSGHGRSEQLAKRGGELLDSIDELTDDGHIAPGRADQLRAALRPIVAQGHEQ